jgi:hypothetical protein
MDQLSVFISHHHEEKLLAQAWQELLTTLTMGEVIPWYSSDERVSRGSNEWWQDIRQRLEEARVILVLVTPISNDKPWLFFEGGYAYGQKKEIIPVCFFMDSKDISVFGHLHLYQGDQLEGSNGVMALCTRLAKMHWGTDPPDASKKAWEPWMEKYMRSVNEERLHSHTRNLFQDHFHNSKSAEKMKGEWFAKWTQVHADGTEDVFEVDQLTVWTTDSRLRMVGTSTKAGRDILTEEGKASARYYPMEGVVSQAGWVALSNWSGGEIPICGTALLAPVGATGQTLVGTWQGFTAKDINEDPSFTQGRVVMSKNRARVEGYWPELRKTAQE